MSTRRTRPPLSRDVVFVGSFPAGLPQATFPEVAIAGRSNVGKSSAINALLGRKGVARVSRTPGRTQAINLFAIGKRFNLADLPGYGFAQVPREVQDRWKGLVEGYLGSRDTLRLVICLVDGRHGPQNNDLALLKGLQEAQIPYRVVATKIDKLSRNQRQGALVKLGKGLGVSPVLGFSSVTREGVDELWALIDEAVAEASP